MIEFEPEGQPNQPVEVDLATDTMLSVKLSAATHSLTHAGAELLHGLRVDNRTLDDALSMALLMAGHTDPAIPLRVGYRHQETKQARKLGVRVQKSDPNKLGLNRSPRAISDQFILRGAEKWQAQEARMPWSATFATNPDMQQYKVTDEQGKDWLVVPLSR